MYDQFNVHVVADSISKYGARLTTMQLRYPRFIHAEFMTHRVFSRNASSSRAIPVAKMLKQVRENPAHPVHWGANIPGMQARAELEGLKLDEAQRLWSDAAHRAAELAEHMAALGLHKQVANRILEPFQLMHVVVSSTSWYNFFALRCHPDAQPEIRVLAELMRENYEQSKPREVQDGQWHLPYVADTECGVYELEDLIKMSVARCARVSYLNHDGKKATVDEDRQLYDRLVKADPPHLSPTEHVASPIWGGRFTGNFQGWSQHRQDIEFGPLP